MGPFYKGQRVRIVHGSYKSNGGGTYIDECGKVSCRVNIDNDAAKERTIRLASILPFAPSPSSSQKGNVGGTDGGDPYYKGSGQWRQHNERLKQKTKMLKELHTLKSAVKDMNETIERLEKELNEFESD
jgi:hypothetical protein